MLSVLFRGVLVAPYLLLTQRKARSYKNSEETGGFWRHTVSCQKPAIAARNEPNLLNIARSLRVMATRGSLSVVVDFPHDPAPVPLKLVVLASAEQVEHDATETKFSELVLHRGLIFAFMISFTVSTYEYAKGG